MKSYNEISRAVARWGVGVVFFIFGLNQLISPENWFGYLPSFTLKLGFALENLVYINGVFDLLVGALLLVGSFVRITSVIGTLHLLSIIIFSGYSDVAVRDFGILIVLISVFLYGADKLCLDKKFFRKIN